MGKQTYFRAKCGNISRTVGDTYKVTIMTMIGSCVCAFDWHQDRWPGWFWTAI